ncbi:unnamed protein product [Phytophthora lilii]|uniref:Unnamed protein product n=1 Tax=Phytophthora lilii TaxID=2077276 RepID=A0A9W6WTD6_9STRA|nr:unnamed protein product [Phytophthora lilii]
MLFDIGEMYCVTVPARIRKWWSRWLLKTPASKSEHFPKPKPNIFPSPNQIGLGKCSDLDAGVLSSQRDHHNNKNVASHTTLTHFTFKLKTF